MGRSRLPWITSVMLMFNVEASAAQTMKFFPSTGAQPVVRKLQGGMVQLYTASAALVVSASDYAAGGSGWAKLPNTEKELDRVTVELNKHGFDVTRIYDPTAAGLTAEMANFLGKYGARTDIRVMFFFSGHGYTNKSNQMSYVVPVDAASPINDYSGFLSRAIALEAFHTWVRQFSAVHVLSVFDTCFSGAIFTTKSEAEQSTPRPFGVEDRWRYLTRNAEKPVRQFIAAGGVDEKLPASSTFVPVFVEALRGGASTVNDGFVTGKEVGVFVERVVSERRGGMQNPVSGVSRDTSFIFGDIIFQFDPTKAERYAAEPIGSKQLAPQIPINPLTTERSLTMPNDSLGARPRTNRQCVEISEQTLINGVSTWVKKCI